MTNLWWELRARCCEMLVGWALAVAPKGYVPSFVSVAADAYKHRGAFESVP